MDTMENRIQRKMMDKNKRGMRLFLMILLLIDVSFYLLILSNSQISGFDHRDVFLVTTPISIMVGVLLLLANEIVPSHGFWMNLLFLLYVTGSRILGMKGNSLDDLAVLPYVSFYLIVASIMFVGWELIVTAAIMQPVLFLLLLQENIGIYKLSSIMLISTLLVLLSCHIGMINILTYRKLSKDDQEMLNGKTLLDGMMSRIDTMVVLIRTDGSIEYVNKAFENLTGLKLDDVASTKLDKLFDKDSLAPIINGFHETVSHNKPVVIENHLMHGLNGLQLSVKVVLDTIQLNDERYVILAGTDLTSEANLMKVKDIVIRLNNMLSEYSSLDEYFDDILKSLIEAIPYVNLGSILLSSDNDIMTMKANVGYDKNKAEKFRLPLKDSFYYRNCGNNMKRPVIVNNLASYSMEGVEDILSNIYGKQVLSSMSCPIIIEGRFQGLLNLDSFQDNVFRSDDLEIMQFLTEQISIVLTSHQLLNKTIYLSRYDQLTGLYNRWQLQEFENEKLPHLIRYDQSFCLAVMDLNNLKHVNDKYGHSIGDQYLIEFSRLLKEESRKSDILMRIGGDEFACVFPMSEPAAISEKLDLINEHLAQRMIEHVVLPEQTGCFSFAYGIVNCPSDSDQIGDLMRLADEKMYEMKKRMKSHGYDHVHSLISQS